MFYQVKVPKEDSNYLRFLWTGENHNLPAEYRLIVHVFGAVSSPSVANYVLKTTADPSLASNAVVRCILNNFYVDDLMKSAPDVAAAINFIAGVKMAIGAAGFRLTGYSSNSRAVLGKIPIEDLSKDLKKLGDFTTQNLPNERALGVVWTTEEDMLRVQINIGEPPSTKRGILSSMFSLYDPYGLVGPVLMEAKRIFQESCRLKMDWDTVVPETLRTAWQKWLVSVHELENFEIPRCLRASNGSLISTELHVFCDGSEKGYGASGYLRSQYEDDVSVVLIMSKSRLTPLNNSTLRTIPRIELNAAKLAVTTLLTIENSLEFCIDRRVMWSDSETVLKYICSETGRFPRFVGNRVSYIRSHTRAQEWKHVPTKENPADLISKGCTARVLLKSNRWKFGPTFLKTGEWPSQKFTGIATSDDFKENPKVMIVKNDTNSNPQPLDVLLSSTSNWSTLKRRVSTFLRLGDVKIGKETTKGFIQLSESRRAEFVIMRYIQKQEWSEAIRTLKTDAHATSKFPCQIKLIPELSQEDGLLRARGRNVHAKIPHRTKHPIILPGSSPLVRMLVQNTHKEIGHMGRGTLMTILRQKYWIMGAGMLVRSVLNECIPCRRIHGRPSEQIMADLPDDRVDDGHPAFHATGLDCFGPFMVTIGRGHKQAKRWGVIFTCLATRAVHLEIVYSLSTDSFILSLRRFMARRGAVKIIRSDNGTNFVGAEKELRLSLQEHHSQIADFLREKDIEWRFQPPSASHFGGVFEREIRTARNILQGLAVEQLVKLTDEMLTTLFCEVESVMNCRPLTPLSPDIGDPNPLTPNHLLLLHSGVAFPVGLFDKDVLHRDRHWKRVSYLADIFWTRWEKEYLPLLQSRQKWTVQRRSHQEGDLVLIVDPLTPRGRWPMGIITEVRQDSRGSVRVAKIRISKVKMGNKNSDTTEVERPIHKLILLKPANDV